jgi:hypothetical protein
MNHAVALTAINGRLLQQYLRQADVADRDGDVLKTRFSASITIQDRTRTSLKIWQRFGEIGGRAAVSEGVLLMRAGSFKGARHYGAWADITSLNQWVDSAHPPATGRTESERTPWAPWIKTPSISAVADGPVWKAA